MIKLPTGSIVAWHKTLANNKGRTTPNGWVECDGIEKDIPTGSPYAVNGKFTPPDLRGVFLRGSSTSGTLNNSETHRHSLPVNINDYPNDERGTTGPTSGNTSYEEIKPPAATVVWIMRII